MVDLKLKIPLEFYKQDIRCNYTVSVSMKKIWAIELDLLYIFDKICCKYDIEYFLCAGTMLGAVRHEGFIPWDDDIDVMMTRNNYDKFMKLAPAELDNNYFLQNDTTDQGMYRGHAQLRNSATTAILKKEFYKGMNFNQGIFIDIFPLDNMPNSSVDRNKFAHRLSKIKKIYEIGLMPIDRENSKSTIKYYLKIITQNILKSLHVGNFMYKKYIQNGMKYNKENTNYCGIIALINQNDRFVWKKEWLNERVKHKFEMLEVYIPCKYSQILNKTYGDWHKLVKGSEIHSGVIYDTEKSYLSYLKRFNDNS